MPADWTLQLTPSKPLSRDRGYDEVLTLRAPDGKSALLAIQVKSQSLGIRRAIDQLTGQLDKFRPMLVAPFIPADLQVELRRRGIAYADTTGNVDIRLSRPGLYISAAGATKNPWPIDRPVRSLRPARAARVVRALADVVDIQGIRQIAALTRTDPGYVSRIVRLLKEEGIVNTNERGSVVRVDREALVRRWATEYDIVFSNRVARFFEPRDLDMFVLRIRNASRASKFDYALTGSWAGGRFAAAAATRVIACFVDDPEGVASKLRLAANSEIANVWLIDPYDGVVYERTRREQGVALAAPAQVLVDLLTSPGRGPAEAESYLGWLRKNEAGWQR
jgi:hypothetical protein